MRRPLLIGSPSPHGYDKEVAIQNEVARIQRSGVLGEARLRALFDYLAEKTQAGESPKEIAIAIDVFGKTPDFDVAQDALVRVYIHKLRKALAEFYGRQMADGASVLQIPRGEYRLKISHRNPISPPFQSPLKNRRILILSGTTLGAILLMLFGFWMGVRWRSVPRTDMDRVRANPIWSGLLKDDRPIMIVLGDYYLIGDADESLEVKRLIREFAVNSKGDLDNYIATHPEFASRYVDLGLRYLPISAALALRHVMMVLGPQDRRITISKMSDLESSNLKYADIVYIGYLSGMGNLQDLVFTGSRFAVGQSYDEVIDRQTRHTYISEASSQAMEPTLPTGKDQSYHDYGIFEKLQGPGGNTIIVIAGTRDEGVSQTAEAFTNASTLTELGRHVDLALPLEALQQVTAFNGTNMTGKLLLQSNRDNAGR